MKERSKALVLAECVVDQYVIDTIFLLENEAQGLASVGAWMEMSEVNEDYEEMVRELELWRAFYYFELDDDPYEEV